MNPGLVVRRKFDDMTADGIGLDLGVFFFKPFNDLISLNGLSRI
jgi:hypothetical protein